MGSPSNNIFLAEVVKNIEAGLPKMAGMALLRIFSAAGRSLSAVSTVACRKQIVIIITL
jgi:hypothetical protein